jgi:hypothetical protein
VTAEECRENARDCLRRLVPWWQIVLEAAAYGLGLWRTYRVTNAAHRAGAVRWTAMAELAEKGCGT